MAVHRTRFDPTRLFPQTPRARWVEIPLRPYQTLIQSNPAWLEKLEEGFNAHIFGGYLEDREPFFDGRHAPERIIHVGLDFWMPAETPVCSPVTGEIIAYHNDTSEGGWGGRVDIDPGDGTIHILAHLNGESVAKELRVEAGDIIGVLGSRTENGGWKPHLHYQRVAVDLYHSHPNLDAYEFPHPNLRTAFPAP